ncbi:MAG: hypothetical protein LAQ69_36865 [Acidobacteriia bacterium]|nr:hypothetical protein [Terriglobia bacterium]
MEELLDALLAAIDSGSGIEESLARAAAVAQSHYQRERPFLDRLALFEGALAGKLAAQHEEAVEIAARFDEALAAGQSRDVIALARRFHAIAQHNIIEEERDAFPLADRCFTEAEQRQLLRAIT